MNLLQYSIDAAKKLVKRAFSVSPESTISIDGLDVKLNDALDLAGVAKAKKSVTDPAGIEMTADSIFEHPVHGRLNYAELCWAVREQRFNEMKKNEGESEEEFAKRKEKAKDEMEKKNAEQTEHLVHSEALARVHKGETGEHIKDTTQAIAATEAAGACVEKVAKAVLADGLGKIPGPESARTNEAEVTAKKDFLFLTSPAAREAAGVFNPVGEDSFTVGAKLYGSGK